MPEIKLRDIGRQHGNLQIGNLGKRASSSEKEVKAGNTRSGLHGKIRETLSSFVNLLRSKNTQGPQLPPEFEGVITKSEYQEKYKMELCKLGLKQLGKGDLRNLTLNGLETLLFSFLDIEEKNAFHIRVGQEVLKDRLVMECTELKRGLEGPDINECFKDYLNEDEGCSARKFDDLDIETKMKVLQEYKDDLLEARADDFKYIFSNQK